MTVFLVPVGREEYELYSETPVEPDKALPRGTLWRRFAWSAGTRWNAVVHAARHGSGQPHGRVARWRDRMVCRVAESLAEQRTLWGLRDGSGATLVFPADLDAAAARATLDRALTRARRHHGRWLVLDTLAFVASGLFMLLPGPNLIAYYFAVRLVGHYLSWRGARQALDRTSWTMQPEAALAELRDLAALPREARTGRVEAIASALHLQRLRAFFDRAAVRAA